MGESKTKINLKDFNNTEKFYNEVFSIPMYVGLKKKDLNANSVEMAMEMIRGTARSMGLEVDN